MINLAQIASGMIEVQTQNPSVVCSTVPATTEVVRVCPPTQSVTIDPTRINKTGGDFFEGTFSNTTDESQDLIFGAGLGIAGAYQQMITTPSAVDAAGFLETSRGTDYDNNAMAAQGFNTRIRSAGMILDSIEIQTDDATQSRTRLFLLKMNNNLELTRSSVKASFCDECGNSAQSTLFTTKFNGPYALNIIDGISYTIEAGEVVDFRLNIAGMDIAGNYVSLVNVAC